MDSCGRSVGATRIYTVSYQSSFSVSVVPEDLASWPLKGDKRPLEGLLALRSQIHFDGVFRIFRAQEDRLCHLETYFNPYLPQYFVLLCIPRLFVTGGVYF